MDSLESRISSVEEELTLAGDWNDRYRLMVEWGEADDPLPGPQCLPEFHVFGCTSPLWLRVRRVGGIVEIRGASPGILPRALVALVRRVFDGLEVVESPDPGLLDRLDLRRHLSFTRVLVLEKLLERVTLGDNCR